MQVCASPTDQLKQQTKTLYENITRNALTNVTVDDENGSLKFNHTNLKKYLVMQCATLGVTLWCMSDILACIVRNRLTPASLWSTLHFHTRIRQTILFDVATILCGLYGTYHINKKINETLTSYDSTLNFLQKSDSSDT